MRISTFFLTTSIITYCSLTFGVDNVEVCRAMIDDKLVDKEQSSALIHIIDHEFDEVCTHEDNQTGRFRSASGSFQRGLTKFGGGSNKTTQSRTVRDMCSIDKQEFMQRIESDFSFSSGRNVVAAFNECITTLTRANIETITGQVDVAENDKGFDIRLRYIAGEVPLSYTMRNITDRNIGQVDSPTKIQCEYGESGLKPEGNFVLRTRSEDVITCAKPVGESISGHIVMQAATNTDTARTRTVEFHARSRKIAVENELEIERRVSLLITPQQEQLRELESKIEAIEARHPSMHCISIPGQASKTRHQSVARADLTPSQFDQGYRITGGGCELVPPSNRGNDVGNYFTQSHIVEDGRSWRCSAETIPNKVHTLELKAHAIACRTTFNQ